MKLITAIKFTNILALALVVSTQVVANDRCAYSNSPLKTKDKIDIYAHRGFRALAPENTLIGYETTLNLGVDVVDIDVNMTKDGVLVATHDYKLNPQSTKDKFGKWINLPIAVRSLTLKQLQTFTVGELKTNSRLKKMYPYRVDKKHIIIPTLEQVIDFVQANKQRPIRFQIEMKTDPTIRNITVAPKVMAKALAKVINHKQITANTEVQAFEWAALLELKKLVPKVKTAFLSSQSYSPYSHADQVSIGDGYLWTAPLKAADFSFNYPQMVHKLNGDLWEPFEMELTKKALNEAQSLGIKIVTWGWTEQQGTDFNYAKIQQLMCWGVDGIITDRPDILRGMLVSHGFPVP
ncbi:hypothetical protein L2734_02515 [Parashewanella spongiae]|uniref:glycerophosphodiester phosphodiesterase family protein n=1 Tax=Parashewanella spongiae TaxID=342950 RepID=UPI0014046B8F|nr:glycerophosphodiester phosphodiesterase family protein [Parashewanella spongiae]MCL1077058.1 hypothetical protein [Parashewanella spongiae]